MSQYEIPSIGTTGDRLLGWLMEAVGEGQSWLDTQRPTLEWKSVYDLLGADDPAGALNGLSNIGYNLVERNARDLVASLSNFRFTGEVRPKFDQKLFERANQLTKLDRSWEKETHAYEVKRANLQHAVAFGTGYLVEEWDKNYWGKFGDIALKTYAPSDVTFVQMPKDHSIQRTYMVILRDEMPMHLARATYGLAPGALTPDRNQPGWLMKGMRAVQKLMGGSPALRVAGNNPSRDTASFPTVDIYRAYIMDGSVNLTNEPMRMGARGTNWAYSVPFMGQEMPTGIPNPATGQEYTRPADENDCRIFPLRRYCIWSRTGVIYDGSSPWWHGQVPVSRVRFNDWAWEALGRSLVAAPKAIQDGIIALMRDVEDASACRLNPALLYDEQLVSRGFAETFNPRMAGARAEANLQGGKIIDAPLGPEYLTTPEGIFEFIKSQESRVNHLMGVDDVLAMAKAKQVPSEGTLEKLLQMAGPIVDDMFRAQAKSEFELGCWRIAYYFQFYTQPRMIRIAGPREGDDDAEEQYMPNSIVPDIEGESLSARVDRAKRYLDEFKYHLEESSVNERHRMVNKLAMLNLKKAGVKIDTWTIAKAWQIPNYGPEPEGTTNVLERWTAEQHLDRELAEELAGGPAGMQGKQGPGRPHTNAKAPSLKQKDGGARTTVATS